MPCLSKDIQYHKRYQSYHEAVLSFLLVPTCLSCPASAFQIWETTWVTWAAIKKYSLSDKSRNQTQCPRISAFDDCKQPFWLFYMGCGGTNGSECTLNTPGDRWVFVCRGSLMAQCLRWASQGQWNVYHLEVMGSNPLVRLMNLGCVVLLSKWHLV